MSRINRKSLTSFFSRAKRKKWSIFGKLADAIRTAEQRGAVVRWDDIIDIWRFDASLRIRLSYHDFLVVVDCVTAEAPVALAEVKSFTAKSQEVGARLAIMASAFSYTQEATDYATENDIRLITLEAIQRAQPEVLADMFNLVLHAYGFKFLWADGTGETAIPEEPEILSFFMREMKIEGPGVDTVPERLMKGHHNEVVRMLNTTPKVFEVPLPEGTTIRHPNTGHKTKVKAFTFAYQLLSACDLNRKEGLGEDPYLLGSVLKEELAKRNPSADATKIEDGFDTKLKAGKYYYNPRFRFSYYCEAVKRSKATIVLVESYQMGRLVQARAELSTDLSSQFVEITDKDERDRLVRMYETFAVSDKNLEGRFKVFAKSLEGAECIDDLPLTPEQKRANKADYFFNNRKIISEFKALQTDTSDKIEAILAPYRETPEWPLFFGAQEIQKILQYLPEREKINERIINAVTESIEGIVEKANRQIRMTKATFNLPDAGGLLVIFNDLVDIFSPEIVAYRVRKSLNKRTPAGELRFPHVSDVLIINGAHYAQLNPTLQGVPILTMPNDVPEAGMVEEFVSSLIQKWGAFDRMPLINIDSQKAPAFEFKKFSDDAKERSGPITVHDFWRREYRKRPYLRPLGKEDLFRHGRQVFEELTPCFLKGVTRPPRERMDYLMARFTHFLEEIHVRGIDMREWTPSLDGFKEKIDQMYPRNLSKDGRQPERTRTKQKSQSKSHKNKIGRGAPCPCQSGKAYSRCCGTE